MTGDIGFTDPLRAPPSSGISFHSKMPIPATNSEWAFCFGAYPRRTLYLVMQRFGSPVARHNHPITFWRVCKEVVSNCCGNHPPPPAQQGLRGGDVHRWKSPVSHARSRESDLGKSQCTRIHPLSAMCTLLISERFLISSLSQITN